MCAQCSPAHRSSHEDGNATQCRALFSPSVFIYSPSNRVSVIFLDQHTSTLTTLSLSKVFVPINFVTARIEPFRQANMTPTAPVAGRLVSPENSLIAVELYESQSQAHELVSHVPGRLLKLFAPSVANHVERDPSTNTNKLRIKIKSLETVDQVEIPALVKIFQHMSTLQRHGCFNLISHPQWTTVRDGVGFYCALRILRLLPQAEFTRDTLLLNMKQKPLVALDVEAIWLVFGPNDEMFDAILRNVASSKMFGTLADEELIVFFLENELTQLPEAKRKDIFKRYYAYKEEAKREI